MIPQTWWSISGECPKCNRDMVLQEAYFSADSELAFTFSCASCQESVKVITTGQKLQHQALMNDMNKKWKTSKAVPAKQRLLPPLTEDKSKEDHEWLHAMGITEEDTNELGS